MEGADSDAIPVLVINIRVSIEVDGVPYRITEFLHVKPGKGSAFVRTKLKNYLNGTRRRN